MKRIRFLPLLLICLFVAACAPDAPTIALDTIPKFSGNAFVAIDDNQPSFSDEEKIPRSYETYAPLDELGRCGVAMACIGIDLMPTEERGSIGQIKPSGWQTVKYDIVDGKYLYNRCHLIGFQLSGENANERNLITGTRYLNIEGMLPFENMVADYVKETENHVLYRVTPIFEGDNLVASGVMLEGFSVEDKGAGICFCVYAYNAQPGITIDYKNGDSWLADAVEQSGEEYILNTNTKKIHLPSCDQVDAIKQSNKKTTNQSLKDLQAQGYSGCKRCNP